MLKFSIQFNAKLFRLDIESLELTLRFILSICISLHTNRKLKLIPNKFSRGQISGTGKVLDTLQQYAFF